MKKKNAAYVIHRSDNVGVALLHLKTGRQYPVIDCGQEEIAKVVVTEDIPFGFKVALANLESGEEIIKYGEVIGLATMRIKRGELVHLHNLASPRGRAAGG